MKKNSKNNYLKQDRNFKPYLKMSDEGLALVGQGMSYVCDLREMIPRLKPGNLDKEMLIRAANPKKMRTSANRIEEKPKIIESESKLTAIDMTAGLGEDSLLLAAAGFNVTLYEKDPIIFQLLDDAISRAKEVPELTSIIERMTLVEGDSIEGLSEYRAKNNIDIIYLDPMFPERKKSGLIKKKFQLLQQLEKPCTEEEAEEMLNVAFAAEPKKIIVKRPIKSPPLGAKTPSYQIKGSVIRFDIYTISC